MNVDHAVLLAENANDLQWMLDTLNYAEKYESENYCTKNQGNYVWQEN